jgi:hypothetical protein
MYSLLFAVLPVCAHTFPFACVATCRTVCSYASSAPMRGGATLTCAYRSGLVEPCGVCACVCTGGDTQICVAFAKHFELSHKTFFCSDQAASMYFAYIRYQAFMFGSRS